MPSFLTATPPRIPPSPNFLEIHQSHPPLVLQKNVQVKVSHWRILYMVGYLKNCIWNNLWAQNLMKCINRNSQNQHFDRNTPFPFTSNPFSPYQSLKLMSWLWLLVEKFHDGTRLGGSFPEIFSNAKTTLHPSSSTHRTPNSITLVFQCIVRLLGELEKNWELNDATRMLIRAFRIYVFLKV